MRDSLALCTRRTALRVANDDHDLVLVVRPDDLDAWRHVVLDYGLDVRLVGSPIVREPGGACAMHEADLVWLPVAIAG